MRAMHTLSHEHKLSCDMGQLVPLATVEVLPGDTFNMSTSLLARVAPLVSPVMHNVEIRVHHWYCPNRIIDDTWEDFIVGEDETARDVISIPADADDYALLDHMGIPQQTSEDILCHPVRAYNKIFNEFYRDQDLTTARTEDELELARICWEKDYFTTARANPVQGTGIAIPLGGGEAPIKGIGWKSPTLAAKADVLETGGVTRSYTQGIQDSTSEIFIEEDSANSGFPDIVADLSGVEAIDIDTLRQSLALQSFAEVRARFGARYVDYLKYLGVNPGDARLQRPEYLGGGSQTINFSEVLAMAEGTSTDVGDLFGHGIASLRARRFRKRFTEHGWLLSLLSVRPKTLYTTGIPRKFQRVDAMDWWQKELEVLPWQSIPNKEIYAAAAAPDDVFGYVPKYDEYRHEFSYVSGSFRPGGTEESFHMSREFSAAPTLNGSFVECTPTDRIYSDTGMPELLITARHDIRAARLVRGNAQFGHGVNFS